MTLVRRKLSPHERLKIVVQGYIVRGPLGGLVWHHLQYVLGLHLMGHDVLFLEDSDDYASCYNPSTFEMSCDPSYGIQFIQSCFDQVGLEARWAYYDAHTSTWRGPMAETAEKFSREADIMLNLSGVTQIRPWTENVPRRAFVDTDPVFVQIRHIQQEASRQLAAVHTDFFTFGENIASGISTVPDDGFHWKATRQPVVLDLWPHKPPCPNGNYTTVMQWDSYQSESYNGRMFGMKSLSFEKFFNLPKTTGLNLEIALGSPSVPREKLEKLNWVLRDPLVVTKTMRSYQEYIQSSKAEFSVAKHGYVESQSGWFSERSTGYLASGRPVIVQDTGLGAILPTGEGVLTFRSAQEAKQALYDVEDRYEHHCRESRDWVSAYFGYEHVLAELLSELE